MDNSVNCQSLFAFNSVFIKNIFTGYEYPWQIIPDIKYIMEEYLKTATDSYTHLKDDVLVGEDVKIDPSVRIEGPAIIGDGCHLRHGAYLRGNVILDTGCVIGNSSEIKNSILMQGAQVPHFNYIGDSVLGEGAHLGAGAICSNLRSDKASVIIKFGEKSLDTGLRKLGAILGDHVEIGCGTVLCPGTVVGKNTSVYPLTLARGVYPKDSIVKQDNTVVRRR